MDATNLSDYQLYEIIQNLKLDKEIRTSANAEFDRRKLSLDQIRSIITKHDQQFKPEPDRGLNSKYRLLIILFPFVIPIQSIFATRWLAKGEKKKWKDYWFYLSLGYLIWTIVIIAFFKLFMLAQDA